MYEAEDTSDCEKVQKVIALYNVYITPSGGHHCVNWNPISLNSAPIRRV